MKNQPISNNTNYKTIEDENIRNYAILSSFIASYINKSLNSRNLLLYFNDVLSILNMEKKTLDSLQQDKINDGNISNMCAVSEYLMNFYSYVYYTKHYNYTDTTKVYYMYLDANVLSVLKNTDLYIHKPISDEEVFKSLKQLCKDGFYGYSHTKVDGMSFTKLLSSIFKSMSTSSFNQDYCNWVIYQLENGCFHEYSRLSLMGRLNYSLLDIPINNLNPYGVNKIYKDGRVKSTGVYHNL